MKNASHVGFHSMGDILMLQQSLDCSVCVCVNLCFYWVGYRKWDEEMSLWAMSFRECPF